MVAILFAATGNLSYAWSHRQDGVEIEVDTSRTGRLTKWVADGKLLLGDGSQTDFLSLSDAEGLTWMFSVASFTEQTEPTPLLILSGRFAAPGGSEIPATLSYRIEKNARRIRVNVETPLLSHSKVSPLTQRWRLPLGLNPRKRIFYQSDYGLEWETRYFYQMTYEPRAGIGANSRTLLTPPDRNEWRFFALDQLGPQSYRLWKSESASTAPLVMHEGRSPVPAVQIYDEQGGVTVEYPDIKHATPASLRVDASGGGLVEIACRPGKKRHEFFLTAHASERNVRLERTELAARYQKTFSEKPDPDVILREPEWVLQTAPDWTQPAYVSGGYPFAKNTLRNIAQINVSVAERPVPVQAKPLAFWPDGSIKWAHLVFPAEGTNGKELVSSAAARISLRTGNDLPVQIGKGGSSAKVDKTLQVTPVAGGGVHVSNGSLQVDLGVGEGWLRRLVWHGKVLVDASSEARRAVAYSDYCIDPGEVFPFAGKPKGGETDRGILKVDTVEMEESGPLRSVVRLEGLTSNREPMRIVLRLEFLAGRSEIRINHTAVLRFKDPRRTFLTGMGIEFPLPVEAASLDGTQRSIQLIQSTPMHQQMLVNGQALENGDHRPGWLRIATGKMGISAVIRNFRQQAPKALSADFETGRLRFELWPQEAPPMDMRRYSNYLHEAQLESSIPGGALNSDNWIDAEYYAKEPVYGIARTHELLLAFDDGEMPAITKSLAADFQSPPLLYAGWDYYTSTGIIMPSSTAEAWPRAWDAWTRLTRFFLWHRELHSWYGFWNYGDFRHRFRSGYGWTHPPQALIGLLNGGASDDPKKMRAERRIDYMPTNDWNYDNGAYGWTNTEGLPGLFLQNEYLRHGNREVYFAAEAMARHSRDVITRHEGRWLGMGTRHGVQPWSDGQHDERQSTITEYRLHYLLSGEARSRDVVENLYRNAYTRGTVKPRSFHSARLGGLLFHWELTGDPDEAGQLRRYMHLFIAKEGIHLEPVARFPGPVQGGEPGWLNSGSQFFLTFGGMHAMLEYQQLTGDEELKAAIIRMADAMIKKPVIEKGLLGNGDYSWPPVAFAALHASDPASFRDFLRRHIEHDGWRNAYQPVTKDVSRWSGPTAFMTKSVALTFFWANWAPYVTYSLGGTEIWSPQIEAEFEKWENRSATRRGLSWQSDYDGIPEIEAYLGPQQPWKQPRGASLPSISIPQPEKR